MEPEWLRQPESSPSFNQSFLIGDEKFKPRSYQLEVCQKAFQENTIIALETGCGKTMIAVMLMCVLENRLRKPASSIAVFLAPTVPLVQQQAAVVKSTTCFKVGCYWGGMTLDAWNHKNWEEEVEKNEVLVMTPQVFLSNLRHCFIKMEMIELLVFDECHHAQKKHPYAGIMNDFYFNQTGRRPRIFGMTASPVIGKGKGGECIVQIQNLERLLHSKVYTISDKTELNSVTPSPVESLHYYDPPYLAPHVALLRPSMAALIVKHLQPLIECIPIRGAAGECKQILKRQKEIRTLHTTLDYCLVELGLWCTQKAVKFLDKSDAVCGAHSEGDSKGPFLRDVRLLLQTLQSDDMMPEVSGEDLSSKVRALLDVLLEYKDAEDLKCIIFVERVIEGQMLAELLTRLSCFSFVRCNFLGGTHSNLESLSRQRQQQLVEQFRSGEINLLVATNIAEEGLDIQSCGLVIRFNLPPTMRSKIQSRGRARRPGSHYITLVERGNTIHHEHVMSLSRLEGRMSEVVTRRDEFPQELSDPPRRDVDTFRVESTGASVNTDCSVSLLYRYCAKLPGDSFYTPAPDFDIIESPADGGVYCIITMPPNAPFRSIKGRVCDNARAKQVACLEACKQLYLCGALDDRLLIPSESEEEQATSSGSRKQTLSGLSSVDLHRRHVPDGLRGGAWGASHAPACLHAYEIRVSARPPDRQYANFALFLELPLDSELGSMELMLQLSRGRFASAEMVPYGKVDFEQDQINNAKRFQTIVFNTLLDPDGASIMHLEERTHSLMDGWDPSSSYLLLPLVNDAGAQSGQPEIDWNAVSKVLSTSGISSEGFVRTEAPVYRVASKKDAMEGQTLQLADGVVAVEDICDTMVVVSHPDHKAFYRIVEVIHDMNASSPFGDSKYKSYTDYFQRRHGVTLVHTEQPLLRARRLLTVHNLLTSRSSGGGSEVASKPEVRMELPPELCKVRMLGFSGPLVHGLSLLPSVMHRLEGMLIAKELRNKLGAAFSEATKISALKILHSLTTGRCQEAFSLESLELLGDAFLKFAVSQRLFLVYEKRHEGQLTVQRSRAICNAALHKLGVAQGLPAFIQDELFNPKYWAVPGRWCKIACDPGKVREIHEAPKDANVSEPRKEFRCSEGHRWITHKTIADVVEALIGTHLVECGPEGALDFMRWMGIGVDFDPSLKVQQSVSGGESSIADHMNGWIVNIEQSVGYTFRSKVRLVEAFTHASYQDTSGFCYQRLEFLGDAVLDFLITKYLYFNFPGLKPGLLTDLRSAAVNNDSFARVAVRNNLHKYLRHSSKHLKCQIEEFVSLLESHAPGVCGGWESDRAPKVLGDIVESLAGAVFLDSNFDLDEVWDVFKSLLLPIATPDNLQIHPVRELQELCQAKGFKLEYESTNDGKLLSVTATVVVTCTCTIVGKAEKIGTKIAKRVAAQDALNKLKDVGFHHTRRFTIEALELHKQPGPRLKTGLPKAAGSQVQREEGRMVEQPCVFEAKGETESGDKDKCKCQGGDEMFEKASPHANSAGGPALPVGGQTAPLRAQQGSSSSTSLRGEGDCVDTILKRTHKEESFERQMDGNGSNKSSQDEIQRLVDFFLGDPKSTRPVGKKPSNGSVDYAPFLRRWSEMNGGGDKERGVPVSNTEAVQAESPSCSSSGADPVQQEQEEAQTGHHRSMLYEACARRKWATPVFVWRFDSQSGKTFQYDVEVTTSCEMIVCSGYEMPNKRKAMDSAAWVALQWLRDQGLLAE